MEIHLSQPALMQALQATAPAAVPIPSFPISPFVLINATKEQTTLHTHNGELHISKVMETTKVETTGKILVEHKLLYNWAARTKPDAVVKLKVETDKNKATMLHCRASRSHIRLGLGDPQSFPPNSFKPKARIAIAAYLLREGLATTSNSRIGLPEKATGDATGPLSGTHLLIGQQYIKIEAVSQSYGAFYSAEHGIADLKHTVNVILPQKISGLLQTHIPNDETLIFIEIEDKEKQTQIKIKYNDIEWYTTLISATFPDTSKFYATETDNPTCFELELDSADLRNAAQMAEMFMQDSTDSMLMWIADEDEEAEETLLALRSLGNEKGNFEGTIPLSIYTPSTEEENDFRMAGAINQLSKIAGILRQSERINLKYRGKKNPGLYITGSTSPNTFYITMPIKIRDELWQAAEA